MSTKNKVLELLEKNRGKSISGEEIAGRLNISRTAVWKAIKSLIQEGHEIQAVTNLGYVLSEESNVLSVQGLLPYLREETYAEKINIFNSLESTNKTAKEMAINGCEHGTVIIADSQTAGNGRYGRTFYSPPGSGLYMSFVLRSSLINLPNVTMITSATAVAVCRAIQTVTGNNAEIKWVNDILLNDKKICGILTEAITDFESGSIDWIVVGIGINIDTQDFPDDLSQTATAIFTHKVGGTVRNRLSAEIINTFLSSNSCLNHNEMYKEYKERLTLLGKRIRVTVGNEAFDATAMDIDEKLRLVVKKTDGGISTLSAGEVSVSL